MHKSPHFNTIGQIYHDFKVTKITDIDELHCQLIELVHIPSGAQVMHIANDDPENLFCLSFQTVPTTSNGVAHVLEHTVLCGSEKYPVKDPFFTMQRRSLNTFMNALTGADFTCYPASSQVPKDFYNLLEVYLDAVFHPNLNNLSFQQEGHRLEFANPDDPASLLEYKGIVFNEMKGAMSGPSTRLNEAISQALFPDLTYGINSGGDPKVIPTLTYQQLCDFHKLYYHPSHCLFFFYGNLPLENHLDFIASNVLTGIAQHPPLSPIPRQPRFKKPKRLALPYPIPPDDDINDKALIAFGWLTCNILEQQDLLALSILEIILMDTDASPLKRALLKSGFCKQASCYMDDEISEVPLIISLKGCNAEHAESLEKVIFATLHEIVRDGISLELVENAMHQLEFFRSEITGDHAPFGLSLFMRSALLKQHNGPSESGLKIHTLFDEVRRRNLENPQYFTDLIQKYILDNTHFVRITLIPDKELAAQEHAQELAVLAAIEKKLTPQQRQNIVKNAAELAEFQNKQENEDIEVLPKVTLSDVPHDSRTFSLTNEKVGNLEVFHHNCFTNEIVYADLIFSLPAIAEADLPYVRLLTTLMPQMGCGGRDYGKNLEYIQAHTGGLHATLAFHLQASDHTQFSPSLYIKGKALHRKVPSLFALFNDLATSIDFSDVSRLKEVIHKQHAAQQSHFAQNSLKYAINLSAIGLDEASRIANLWYGLEYYETIKELSQNFHQHESWLVEKLNFLKQQILGNDSPNLVISSDASMYDTLKGHGFYGLKDLATTRGKPWNSNYPMVPSRSQGRFIASPIAFTSKVFKTVSYTHPDSPALNIASYLFDNLTLHTRLREQGGAYGGGAVSTPMAGNFYFYSYRDPNIVSTLDAFEESIQLILKGKFDSSDIEEAKLEMVQALDSPVAPGSRADLAYGWKREGKTTEVRQAFRDRTLSLTRKDIIKAVERHVVSAFNEAATVVFGGKELLEKENAKLVAAGKKPLPLETV